MLLVQLHLDVYVEAIQLLDWLMGYSMQRRDSRPRFTFQAP